MTKVKFYLEGKNNEVFAVFPEIIADNKGNLQGYAHLGQHTAICKEYLKGKKLANEFQYNDLLSELMMIGYDDLQVIDSRKTLSKIVYPVNCQYGAPMGRSNKGEYPLPFEGSKVITSKVQINEGYDKGGAYWGNPNNLYVDYTKDLQYIKFYRK